MADGSDFDTTGEMAWVHRFTLVLALLGGVLISLPLAGLTEFSRWFRFIPITGVYILIGICLSLTCLFFTNLSDAEILYWYGLDSDVFLLFLLPPIIFAGTINIQQYHFFRHFVNILTLSIFGTLISTATITVGIWYLGQKGWFTPLNIAESGAFGGLMSATDPVAALAVFGSVGVNQRLFSVVVGEALFNDAVGIVIYQTAVNFFPWAEGTSTDGLKHTMISAVTRLVMASVISLLSGFLLGLLFSFILKVIWYFTSKHELLISILFWLCGYISFIVGQTFHMSGIIVEVFCVLTLRHYGFYNLPPVAKETSVKFCEQVSILVETLVYIQMGTNIVIETDVSWFAPATILLMYIGRALSIFSLLPLYNIFMNSQIKNSEDPDSLIERKTTFKEMLVIWFVGQRGPVALSLALTFPGSNRKMIVAATVLVIMQTIYVHGIPVSSILEGLGLVHLENRSVRESRFVVQMRKLKAHSKNDGNPEDKENENNVELEEGQVQPKHSEIDSHKAMVQKLVSDPLIGHGFVGSLLAWDIKYIRPIFTIESSWSPEMDHNDIELSVISRIPDIESEEASCGDVDSTTGSDNENRIVDSGNESG
eukprot:TRINITY_DN4017_c0_g2_i1.p1 TRINITY_DN4017_c0_g2~~TRINITY_DN4017_c0_g2_i1.p1  ORF type:complete len:596 (-),score=63.83 TRINITY_DN4017_c0_g2_i1:18-1805(-)